MDVEKEKVTWLQIYGVPCHAWKPIFFEFITKLDEDYMCYYNGIREQ